MGFCVLVTSVFSLPRQSWGGSQALFLPLFFLPTWVEMVTEMMKARPGRVEVGRVNLVTNSMAEGLRDPLPGAGAPWNVGSASASFASHLSGSWKRKWKETLMSWQSVHTQRSDTRSINLGTRNGQWWSKAWMSRLHSSNSCHFLPGCDLVYYLVLKHFIEK